MQDVSIRIKPIFDSTAALSSANRYGKEIINQDRSVVLLNKHTADMLKRTEDGFVRLKRVVGETGSIFTRTFSAGVTGLEKFSTGVDGLVSKFLNLKNVILASSAAYALSKFYKAGAEDRIIERRVKREFGGEAEGIIKRASAAAAAAGIENNQALQAVRFIARSANVYQAGERVAGRETPLNEADATKLRSNAIENGTKLFERIQTLYPELTPADTGRTIANALSSPKNLRALTNLIPDLEHNRIFMALATASEEGKVEKVLSAANRKKYKEELRIRHGSLSPLSLANIALASGGITEEAERDERNTTEFSLRASKAKAENAIAKKSKDLIGEGRPGFISNAISKTVDFTIKNQAALGTGASVLGGLYSAGKGIGFVHGLFGKSKLGGALDAVSNAAAQPVRVVNFSDMSKSGGIVDNILNKVSTDPVGSYVENKIKDKIKSSVKDRVLKAIPFVGLALAGVEIIREIKAGDKAIIEQRYKEQGKRTERGSTGAWGGNPAIGNTETQAANGGAPSVHIGGIHINASAITNPIAWADSVMPIIKRALIDEFHTITAGGTAPISRQH